MDGKASEAVRSEIHSPEACEVNSAVWVQERAGQKAKGAAPGQSDLLTSPGFQHQM
jgi:hypothetical protein